MGNQRDKKLYIRYDGNNRAIASSAIWRKQMPTVGKWEEVTTGYLCCNTTTTTTTTIS